MSTMSQPEQKDPVASVIIPANQKAWIEKYGPVVSFLASGFCAGIGAATIINEGNDPMVYFVLALVNFCSGLISLRK